MRISKAIKKLIEEDPKTALALGVCISEMARIKLGYSRSDDEFLNTANDMAREFYIGKKVECFFVVSADKFGRDIKTYVGANGTPQGCGLSPREFLQFILSSACTQVVIFHNHPSLSTDASSKDNNIKMVIDDTLSTLSVHARYAVVTAEVIKYY